MGGDGGEKQTDVTNGGDDGRNGGADGAVGVADGGMFLQNSQARWGEGGRLNANCSQICPAPLDGNPVVSVGVSKVCTDTLVSIGYGAFFLPLRREQKGKGREPAARQGGCALKDTETRLSPESYVYFESVRWIPFQNKKNKCALQSISFLEGLIGRLKARIMANDGGFCAVFKMLNLNTAVFRCKCLERHGLSHG